MRMTESGRFVSEPRSAGSPAGILAPGPTPIDAGDAADPRVRDRPGGQRILCVTSNFPRWRGDSTTPFVLHLAEDLQALGWRVEVLAPHAPGAAVAEVIDGVRVERFRYLWPEELETVCYQGGALINLRARPQERLKLPALVAAQWLAVRQRLASGNYDLLHTHWLLPQGYVGALVAPVRRVPHVTTVHGGDIFALRSPLLQRFKRVAARAADRVTANSSVTERAVRALGLDAASVVRIPMGVDLEVPARDAPPVRLLRERHRRGAGPLLVCVGRLVEEKGTADLLRAVALLAADCPDLRALVIGDGQDRSAFEWQVRALDIENRVSFTGWIQSQDVSAYIAAADVFINPSRRASNGWVEAQGLAILEAMAAGTPVIATAEGGVVDAVAHEKTGLLVPHHAPDQIAAAVLRLWRQPGLAAGLASAAKARVGQRFSRECSARAFSTLFEELLAERARP